MIDFMIIGLPRSATTWAANWLTTEHTFCLHDPLYSMHYEEWDTDKTRFPANSPYCELGVSCTGIWRWPEWVNAHPSKKLIITRNIEQVHAEMEEIGLPRLPDNTQELLNSIEAIRVPHSDLFLPEKASGIWSYLFELSPELLFCPTRHAMLCEFNVQPNFQRIKPNREATTKLYNELLMK